MGTYRNFRTDATIEREGLILDLGDSGKFKIARAGGANDKYQQKLFQLLRPHRRAMQLGTLDPKVDRAIAVEAFVDAILLGWEGVTDENGEALAYSRAAAMKLFTDLPDLLSQLQQSAGDASLFREEYTESDAKN
jgi:hypothetical protein